MIGEYLVEWDKELLKKKHYYASGKRLIADDVWVNTNSNSDPLAAQRSLIRHDADRVARIDADLFCVGSHYRLAIAKIYSL